jgi:putative salt-induced outer membrane protein
MNLRALISTVLLVLPLAAMADDPPPPPQQEWIGKGQAGYVATQGNSDSKSANAALDAAYLDGPWKHAFHLGGLYGESSGITAAERWDAQWQSNYDITPDFYTFGALRYTHDDFSGFQYQESIAAGLGYKLVNTATTKLDAQLGVGFRELRPELITKAASGAVIGRTLLGSESGAVLSGAINYSQALTATTTLSNKLAVETGSADTLITDALALTVKVSTKLALSLGYNWQDNTKPPGTLKKTDTMETVNLVYSF